MFYEIPIVFHEFTSCSMKLPSCYMKFPSYSMKFQSCFMKFPEGYKKLGMGFPLSWSCFCWALLCSGFPQTLSCLCWAVFFLQVSPVLTMLMPLVGYGYVQASPSLFLAFSGLWFCSGFPQSWSFICWAVVVHRFPLVLVLHLLHCGCE